MLSHKHRRVCWGKRSCALQKGISGAQGRIGVEGQGVNGSSANGALLSSWPLTLVPSRPQERDSAVKLPHAGFCNRPFPSSPAQHWCVPGVGPSSWLEMSLPGASSGPWEREGLLSPALPFPSCSSPQGKVWRLLRKRSNSTLL